MTKKLIKIFGPVFEPELISEIEQIGNQRTLTGENILIASGDYVRAIPLVLEGNVKVIRVDEEGNELLLYFLHPGETCAMALSCCLGYTKSMVKVVAETPVEVVTIPIQKMEEWSGKYKSWRDFVLKSYHKQLMNAFETIDTTVISKLDECIVLYLERRRKISRSNEVRNPLQYIYNNWNSSSVVISSLLKQL